MHQASPSASNHTCNTERTLNMHQDDGASRGSPLNSNESSAASSRVAPSAHSGQPLVKAESCRRIFRVDGDCATSSSTYVPLASVSIYLAQKRRTKSSDVGTRAALPLSLFYVPEEHEGRSTSRATSKTTWPDPGWTVFGQPNTNYKLVVRVPSLHQLQSEYGTCRSRKIFSSPSTVAVIHVGGRVVSAALLSMNGQRDASFSWSVHLRWKTGNGTISVRFFAAIDAPVETSGVTRWKVGRHPDGNRPRWTRLGVERPGCGVSVSVLNSVVRPLDEQVHNRSSKPYILKQRRTHKVDEFLH